MSITPPPVRPDIASARSSLSVKFSSLETMLSSCLIERDEEAHALLRCLLAQEHMLLVGVPGTAKSLLCSSLGQSISNANVFEVLLTKYSTPEDVFGPISLQELKADRYVRKTDRYLPWADIGFIDEVFKASTSIINSLLTLMNERVYDNGGNRCKCPLRILVGASNEYPQGDELGAAFDRFLVRKNVRQVSESRLSDLLFLDLPLPVPTISLEEMDLAHKMAMVIPFSDAAKNTMFEIIEQLASQGIVVGDRRKRKATKIAKADAFIDGSTEVKPIHLEPLIDVLWSDPIEHPAKAKEIITKLANPAQSEVSRLISEVDEVIKSIKADPYSADVRRTATRKLADIEQTARAINTPRSLRVADLASKQWRISAASALNVDAKFSNLVTGP